MTRIAAAYAAALVAFLIMDGLWLGVVAKNFYKAEIGDLLLPQPNFAIAALFYLFFVAGILLFAVWPGLAADSWLRAAALAAFLGLLAYGTYDITNLATLKGYSVKIAVADMLWGAVVTTVSASAAFFAARMFPD